MTPIRRGDVFRVAFGQGKGHELKDPHYAVVIQSDAYPLGTVIVVPLSSSAAPVDWRVPVQIVGQVTYALVEQVRAIDVESRLREYVGTIAHTDVMASIEEELAMILGIHEVYRGWR
jgi:mRNA-degrading endonuclease toxin of MazEF toxin-antitoxin module